MKNENQTTTKTDAKKDNCIIEIEQTCYFTQITNQITKNNKLSDFAIRLYGYLKSHTNNFYLSYRTITNYLNISRDKLNKGINELKKSGFLEIKELKGKNQYKYILHDKPSNKDYEIVNNIEKNGYIDFSIYDIELIIKLLNNRHIDIESREKLKQKLDNITKYNVYK